MNRRTFSKLLALCGSQMFRRKLWAFAPVATWQPKRGPLKTRWTKDVSPDHALPEYPRPSMVREQWQTLNGLWNYAVIDLPHDGPGQPPAKYDGTILVPYPIESQLSGVMRAFLPTQQVWYARTFRTLAAWSGGRVLLHFDAVDFQSTVWLNGTRVGEHKGGYDRFSFDITDLLRPGVLQELLVAVVDPSNKGDQAHGKQSLTPRGASYTASSGIWQTVWLEAVPGTYVQSLKITSDVDRLLIRVTPTVQGDSGSHAVEIVVSAEGRRIAAQTGRVGEGITVAVPNARLWSPESPFLYDLSVRLLDGRNRVVDQVASYCGMRKISVSRDAAGVGRLFLNGKTVFQQGPLDQGFWPESLYTAPTDEALRADLEYMKAVGFNTVRKHVKVEPERWYYWTDRLGLMVWQDMPAGELRSAEARFQWEIELEHHVENHFNHPSIIMWVIFNEGWGQYETERLIRKIRRLDFSRLINGASGWYDKRWGDVVDMHFYPGPSVCSSEEDRAVVTGEFGGLGFVVADHAWKAGAWGYQTFNDRAVLSQEYQRLWQRVHTLRDDMGLSAAIYTQITDVETESNGLLSYDREVEKIDRGSLIAVHSGRTARWSYRTILPLSKEEPQTWSYTTASPPENWAKADFDSSSWVEGKGGFGSRFGMSDFVRSRWDTKELWLRRKFTVSPEGAQWPLVSMFYGVDSDVYINGLLASRPEGFHNSYGLYDLNTNARISVKPGDNTIAVHVIQRDKGGDQYFDIGLIDERNA